MTIHVVTPEHGAISFPDAEGWETLNGRMGDKGNLSILDSEDENIAEFSKGAWLHVYETLDSEDPEPAQGEWLSLADVPINIEVTDICGDLWTHNGDLWESTNSLGIKWTKPYGASYDRIGPFTEVLDK